MASHFADSASFKEREHPRTQRAELGSCSANKVLLLRITSQIPRQRIDHLFVCIGEIMKRHPTLLGLVLALVLTLVIGVARAQELEKSSDRSFEPAQ